MAEEMEKDDGVVDTYTDEFILNDITVLYIYTFRIKESKSILNYGLELYKKEICKAFSYSKDSILMVKENFNSSLEMISNFESIYFQPDYLALGRLCQIELVPIRIKLNNRFYSVRLILSIHDIGVAAITFLIENIDSLTFQSLLKRVLFLGRIKSQFDFPEEIGSLRKNGLSIENSLSLDELFLYFVRITLGYTEFEKIDKRFSRYVSVFVSDFGNKFETPDDFINAYPTQVFNLVCSRFHYRECDFSKSRNNEYIRKIIGKKLSSRRYVVYFLTSSRMIAFSSIKYNEELHPYDYTWYLSYVSMLVLIRIQHELLVSTHRLLHRWRVDWHPFQLSKLKSNVARGLEEYLNVRFPIDERTTEFVENCKVAMKLENLMSAIEGRLSNISETIIQHYEIKEQESSDATAAALNILTLVFSIPIAADLVDRGWPILVQFLMPIIHLSDSPHWIFYLICWALLVSSFFLLRWLFLFRSKSRDLTANIP